MQPPSPPQDMPDKRTGRNGTSNSRGCAGIMGALGTTRNRPHLASAVTSRVSASNSGVCHGTAPKPDPRSAGQLSVDNGPRTPQTVFYHVHTEQSVFGRDSRPRNRNIGCVTVSEQQVSPSATECSSGSMKCGQHYTYPSMRNTSSQSAHHGPSLLPVAPGTRLSCIPSVSSHHRRVTGQSLMDAMSASKSSPMYLM